MGAVLEMSAFVITLRSLARSPGYALAAVLTLALGIGASTAMFSLMHASLLRPLPYAAPDDLLRFRDLYLPTGGSGAVRTANFMDLQRSVRGGELAAYEATSFNVATEDRPERITALRVTSNFPRVLGVSPVVGRTFVEGEDRAGSADVVLIGHRIWQERFEGRTDIVGETMLLDARPYSIIGVLSESFWYPGSPELLVPFPFTAEQLEQRGNRWLDGIARLAPGTTAAQLDAEMNAVFDGIREQFPDGNTDWAVWTASFSEWAFGPSRNSLLLVNGAVLLLLLIGGVNVASLMLVRAERRSREMAMRVALGAGRGRIAAEQLGESLLLAALGAAAGVPVAAFAMRALVALFGASLPRAQDVSLSLPVLAFSAGTALMVGLLVGLVLVARTNTGDVYATLREAGRGGARRSDRTLRVLVTAEVALAVMLVAGAALLVHSFVRLNAVDPGVDLDNAMVFSVQLPVTTYETSDATAAFYGRALDGIHGIPGVVSAGVSERTPMQGGFNITTVTSPLDLERTASFVEIRSVTPGFFAAAGIPIIAGRGITADDLRDDRNVMVMNEELVRALYGDVDPVGTMFGEGDGALEVVGVVGSVREFGVTQGYRPGAYFPLQLIGQSNSMVFVVRTAGDPMAVVPDIRRVIAEIDPLLPIFSVRTLQDVVMQTVGTRWLATNLFAAFGVMALFLAAFGIFGVLAYAVEQRTREIGVRMALGATRSRVSRMVVADGMRLALVGLGLGLLATAYGSSLVADLLWEVEPTDAGTLAVAAAVTLGTAALATLMPALRATRIEPAIALGRE
jgi:putative ABC transport system permease protein